MAAAELAFGMPLFDDGPVAVPAAVAVAAPPIVGAVYGGCVLGLTAAVVPVAAEGVPAAAAGRSGSSMEPAVPGCAVRVVAVPPATAGAADAGCSFVPVVAVVAGIQEVSGATAADRTCAWGDKRERHVCELACMLSAAVLAILLQVQCAHTCTCWLSDTSNSRSSSDTFCCGSSAPAHPAAC